jgi:hypothetical protein
MPQCGAFTALMYLLRIHKEEKSAIERRKSSLLFHTDTHTDTYTPTKMPTYL